MFPWSGARVHSDVPPERKPERAYIRQNHPYIYIYINYETALLSPSEYGDTMLSSPSFY